MDFTIRIADTNILIHSVYPRVYKLCSDYLVDANTKPDIELCIDEHMINDEYGRLKQFGEETSSLGMVENLLVYKCIAETLLERNVFLMHGAVIAVNNNSFLFTGKSGTGKTTHIQKWIDSVEGSFVVNGDKPLIAINDNGVFACGTPWCGKERFGKNINVPLQSIVFMERSSENHIMPVSFKSIFTSFLEQIYQPEAAEKMKKTLELMKKTSEFVSFYKFYFNNYKEDSFQTSYDALIGDAGNCSSSDIIL